APAGHRWPVKRARAGAAAPNGCPKTRREPPFARSRAATSAPRRLSRRAAPRGDDEMQPVTAASSSEGSRAEVERQLEAVAERHREAVASMQELGRPQAGQYVAIKLVGRAVNAVCF